MDPFLEPNGSILLISDNAELTHLVAKTISAHGRYFLSETLEEGLALVEQERPDIVLIGLDIDQSHARHYCQALKTISGSEHCVILFILTDAHSLTEPEALHAGASDTIVAPFCTESFSVRIHTYLKLKHHTKQLESYIDIDRTTGAFNYQHFLDAFELEWRRHVRQQAPVAVGIIDVFDFDAFNQACNQAEADACLSLLANALKNCLRRPAEIVARYDGARFICLLPNTSEEDANKFKDWLTDQIAHLKIHHPTRTGTRLELVCGFASLIPSQQMYSSELIDLAQAQHAQALEEKRQQAG